MFYLADAPPGFESTSWGKVFEGILHGNENDRNAKVLHNMLFGNSLGLEKAAPELMGRLVIKF